MSPPRKHRRSPRIAEPKGKTDDIHKKLREAEFFLGKLRKHDRDERLDRDRDRFGFYTSAFLSAARTVIYTLRPFVGPESIWWKGLSKDEQELFEDLKTLRDDEIHVGQSDQAATIEREPATHVAARRANVRSVHSLVVTPHSDDEYATMGVKVHWFKVAGKEVRVVDLCGRGVALLATAIAGFVSSGKLPPPR